MSNDSKNSPKDTPDLKKMVKDDFKNIIGVINTKTKSKTRQNNKQGVSKVSKMTSQYERYNFGNLDQMLVDTKEFEKDPEKALAKTKLIQQSEPDNDMYH